MNTGLLVSVAGIASVPGDIDGNLAGIDDVAREAAAQGVDVLILPELAGCGYTTDADILWAHAESLAAPGRILDTFREISRQRSLTMVAGFAERQGDRLFNSAAVVYPDGSIPPTYRKLHLFQDEADVFHPGDHGLPLFDVGGHKIGVAVCFDLRFPEVVRILAARGASLIAVPTAWTPGFDAPPSSTDVRITQIDGAVVQANLSRVPIACAGMVEPGGAGPRLLGRSTIIDERGTIVAGPLREHESGLLVHRVAPRTVDADPLVLRRTDVYDSLLGYTHASP